MKSIVASAVVLTTLLLVGQASAATPNLEKAGIKRIFVAHVKVPKKAHVINENAGIGALIAGPLGGMLADGSSDIHAAYAQDLAKNNIDIGSMVAFEVMNQLTLKGFEVVDVAEQADAVLNMEITQYGLTGGFFDDKRWPQLAVKCTLTNREGKRVWKEWAAGHVLAELPKIVDGRPIQDYFNDPQFHYGQMQKVHTMVIASLFGKM